MTVIETKRLTLRQLTEHDAAFIHALYGSQDFLNYIGDKGLGSKHDALVYLRDNLIPSYENQGFGLYCVERKNDGTALGICGLVKRDFLADVDIGYGFLTEFYGQGYAHESSQAVVTYARNDLKLNALLAITQSNNAASIKLLKKLGFDFLRVQDNLSDAIKLELYELPLIDIDKGPNSANA